MPQQELQDFALFNAFFYPLTIAFSSVNCLFISFTYIFTESFLLSLLRFPYIICVLIDYIRLQILPLSLSLSLFFLNFFIFLFLGPYPWNMEVPSLGIE